MKKLFLFGTVAVLLLLFSGCSNDNVIYVYNWGDYIEPEVIESFTEETGIKVVYEMYDSNEAMYAKLMTGAVDYDIIIPSDYMIEKLIAEDMLLPIDYNNIPNYQYIEDDFKNLAYDADNQYSVPYFWGTVGILYNTTMVDETVDSWNILWDEKYAGKILMQNSVRDAFAVSLKRLGYSVNTTDKGQIDEAAEALKAQKPLVSAYVIDEVRDKMIGGEAALAVIYSGEAIYTAEENSDLAYAIPKEGSNMWFDAMCIPKTSNNKEAAEKFINFMCESEIAYQNADYIGYSSPHSGAKELLGEEVLSNPSAYPPQDILDRCEVFIDLGVDINQYYVDKWNEVKSDI